MNAAPDYDTLVANGVAPRLADMLASRKAPGTRGTDSVFLQGQQHDPFAGLSAWETAVRAEQARAAGIVTTGKVFKSGLADKRGAGDPLAWVSSMDDVKKAAAIKGKVLQGAVNYTPPELPPKPDIKLAEDLVRKYARQEIAKDPTKKWNKRELREKVIAERGARD